jgi:type 2 lantibiotic biosynthesis protein LanM
VPPSAICAQTPRTTSTTRYEQWKTQPPFQDASLFAKRLKSSGLDDAMFRLILEFDNRAWIPSATPDWLNVLRVAFDQYADDTTMALLPEASDLSIFCEPLVRYAQAQLALRIRHLRTVLPQTVEAVVHPLPDDVEALFAIQLRRTLTAIFRSTLILELHVARLQETLPGETPEARFHAFVHQLTSREVATGILAEYPVFARSAALAVMYWLDATYELLEHLSHDWHELQDTWGDTGPLCAMQCLGDPHRHHRHVYILEFRNGIKIVYKPRPLAVEKQFQQLLEWLNSQGARPHLRTLTVLSKSDYGWVEFIGASACTTDRQVRHFYERIGALLAIFYALSATDFHLENLIAAGEHPVAVDLETLFHPKLAHGGTSMDGPELDSLDDHVMWLGLLPARFGNGTQDGGIDYSGIGAANGPELMGPQLRLQHANTDQMRLIVDRLPLEEGQHRPTFCGQVVNPASYQHEIVSGFVAMYKLLRAKRHELLSPSGPLQPFRDMRVRCLLRPTAIYSRLLVASLHPDFGRDALLRDQHFDRLWLDAEHWEALSRLIPAERVALERLDIPLFTTKPGSRHLYTCNGEVYENVLHHASFDRVAHRLARFGPDDMERQRRLIQASMATLTPHPKRTRRQIRLRSEGRDSSRHRFLDTAEHIAQYIEHLAIHSGNRVSWIDVDQVGGDKLGAHPLGDNLYSGHAGLALFFGYLAHLKRSKRWANLAHATLRLETPQPDFSFQNLGLLSGLGGRIYTLTHLAILQRDEGLWQEAKRLVHMATPLMAADQQYDVTDGTAGFLLAMVALLACASPDEAASLGPIAQQAGNHLVTHARPMPCGVGWSTSPEQVPLAGFSHGTAGIALALARLARALGEMRYLEMARAALSYEDSLFDPARKNWRDERIPRETDTLADDRAFTAAWCHGAPGIGLARLRLQPLMPEADTAWLERSVDAAVEGTLESGFGYNDSLCHGDFGNLEFLSEASRARSCTSSMKQVQGIAHQLIDIGQREGWRSGLAIDQPTLGLMTGLAGTGYALLRLYDPQAVPSVLAVDPPQRTEIAEGVLSTV